MLAKRQLAEFVCDTVNLEGMNFTLPEIQTLLDGITVGGHKLTDQLMLDFYETDDQKPMNIFMRTCLDDRVIKIMKEELNIPYTSITKRGKGSELIKEERGEENA